LAVSVGRLKLNRAAAAGMEYARKSASAIEGNGYVVLLASLK
jgi:hypothetical protein